MTNQSYKFRGGIWIGWLWANSWPNVVLEVSQDSLILRDEMIHKEFKFSKGDITKIEIKKFFPIIGYCIRIHHNNKNYNERLFFGYPSFKFNKLLEALKECDWLN